MGIKAKAPMVHANTNTNKQVHTITANEIERLRRFSPLDVKLYEHAQVVFEARWKAYMRALAQGHLSAESAGDIPRVGSASKELVQDSATATNSRATDDAEISEPADWEPIVGADMLDDFVSGVDM